MRGYPYRELTSESVRYNQEHMAGACEEYAAGEGFFGYRMDLAFRRCEIKLTETQTVEAMARSTGVSAEAKASSAARMV